MEQTRRQEIRVLLIERSWTLDELASRYLVRRRIITEDLAHIARSVAPRQRIQVVTPPCDACGFRFKDRRRFSDPSRCPRCKNERLAPQQFRIA
jgi:hypothetical protein